MNGKRVLLGTILATLLSTISITASADYYVITSWSDTPCCAQRYTYNSCGSYTSACDSYYEEDDYYYSRRTTVRYPVAFVGTREYAWVPFP